MPILDTNAVIYYLDDEPRVVERLRPVLADSPVVRISAVTVAELFSSSLLSEKDKNNIEEILEMFICVPLDMTIARLAGDLRAQYRVKLADSMIAATAIATGSVLFTRNVRDFQHIPLLSVQVI